MQKFKTATSEQLSRLTFAQPVQSDGHEKKLFSCHLQVGEMAARPQLRFRSRLDGLDLRQATYCRIHGATEPRTIRQSEVNGCIPMLNDYVIQLYGQVPVRIPVTAL